MCWGLEGYKKIIIIQNCNIYRQFADPHTFVIAGLVGSRVFKLIFSVSFISRLVMLFILIILEGAATKTGVISTGSEIDDEAASAYWWTDVFLRYFVFDEDCTRTSTTADSDDLLFFVRRRRNKRKCTKRRLSSQRRRRVRMQWCILYMYLISITKD